MNKGKVSLQTSARMAVIDAKSIIVAGAMLVLGTGLIIADKTRSSVADNIRISVTTVTAPLASVLQYPVTIISDSSAGVQNFLAVYHENKQLRQQIATLEQWYFTGQHLAAENRALRQAASFIPQPSLAMETVRVVNASNGPFAHSVHVRMTGNSENLENRVALVNGVVIGRAVRGNSSVATILLLTDISSKIPVRVQRTGEQAIIAGTGTTLLEVQHLPEKAVLAQGDMLVTSGAGGVYPADLPVAVIQMNKEGHPVAVPLASTRSLDYVQLVEYYDDLRVAVKK